MKKIELFLAQLENFEVANFYKFKFDSFMPSSQSCILEELKTRKISLHEIEKYTTPPKTYLEAIDKALVCPRCLSDKYYNAKEKDSATFSYVTVDYDYNAKTCLVCSYSKDKVDNKKVKRSLFSVLNFLRKRSDN